MTNILVSKPKTSVIDASMRVSWFEFLLDENLLEKHLSNAKADPSAKELIGLFLYQAESAVLGAKDQVKELNESIDHVSDTKKAKALRILALQVVAHMKWNLDLLDHGIPLVTVFTILTQLLRVTMPTELEAVPHFHLDLNVMPAEALFALQLYHRWCLKMYIQDCFPQKAAKQSTVSVPGLLDPLATIQGSKETVMKTIRDGLNDSIVVLTKFMSLSKGVNMPTMYSFGRLNENVDVIVHDWSRNVPISQDENKCQIGYDLGCMMFTQEKYDKAAEYFSKTLDLFKKIGKRPLEYCKIDELRLEGYCMACLHLQSADNKFKNLSLNKEQTIQGRLQRAISNNKIQEVLTILREDNKKFYMPYPMRIAVEETIMSTSHFDSSDKLKALACTAVRRVQQQEPVPPHIITHLAEANLSTWDYIREVCGEGLRSGTTEQRAGVKALIRYLCQVMDANSGFISCFKQLLSDNEESEMALLAKKQKVEPYAHQVVPPKTNQYDNSITQGEYERELLQTFEPSQVLAVISKISPPMPRKALQDQFPLPRELLLLLEELKCPHKDGAMIHICLAKGKTALQLKNYDKSSRLFGATLDTLKNQHYRLSTVIRWEKLNVDLCHFTDATDSLSPQQVQEIASTVKAAINTLQGDATEKPSLDILCNCTSFLLSVQEYDYLFHINVNQGIIAIGRLIALMCKDLPNIKAAREHAREFWDAVVLVYTSSVQQKRSHTGAVTASKETNLGIVSQQLFLQLICNIRDISVLSALVSCLTKLYNIITDNLHCEVMSDYLTMWPTAVASAGSLNSSAVSEAVNALMSTALTAHPKQHSLIRTQGDIHYASNEHNEAMQCYLQLGVIMTDYFHEPITKNVYDDVLYKKMIRCSTSLGCHTQAAVMCQCLEEPDYGVAFKSLQEQNNTDAMDSYYQYFWNITMLEYLINLHTKRGELQRKNLAVQCIRQLDLNSSNPVEVLVEARRRRQSKFFCALVKQYL